MQYIPYSIVDELVYLNFALTHEFQKHGEHSISAIFIYINTELCIAELAEVLDNPGRKYLMDLFWVIKDKIC